MRKHLGQSFYFWLWGDIYLYYCLHAQKTSASNAVRQMLFVYTLLIVAKDVIIFIPQLIDHTVMAFILGFQLIIKL